MNDGPGLAGARRYRITHHTTYDYDDEVTDSYGLVFSRPRDLPGQHVREHALWTDPGHADLGEHRDSEGNVATYFHVTEPHRRLTVSAVSVVDCVAAAGPAGGDRSAVGGRPPRGPARPARRRARLGVRRRLAPGRARRRRGPLRRGVVDARSPPRRGGPRGGRADAPGVRLPARQHDRRHPGAGGATGPAAASARTSRTSSSRGCGRTVWPRATSAATSRPIRRPAAAAARRCRRHARVGAGVDARAPAGCPSTPPTTASPATAT